MLKTSNLPRMGQNMDNPVQARRGAG